TYRVTGNVAGVRAALFSLVEGDMHLGEYGVFAEHALTDLHVEADGLLELWIAPDTREGNWMATDPSARMLLVRQYLCDWECDRAATLTIERVDTAGEPPPSPPSAGALVASLDRAATWVDRSLDYWSAYVERSRAHLPRNAISPPSTPKGGAPNIGYGA